MAQRQLETIYCDDIRHELGGKVSYIGVYNGQMWVQEFPIVLPKLCVAYKIVLPDGTPTDSLKIIIYRDDVVLFETELADLPDVKSLVAEKQAQGIEAVMAIQNGVIFSPLVIDAPCRIRINVKTSDGQVTKATALEIRQPPEGFQLQGQN